MSGFLILKTLHVLSAIVALGANLTYPLWTSRAERDPAHLGFALRGVKLLDDRVANPAYGVLLITGLIMAFTQYSITLTWILAGLVIFVVVAGLATALYSPALSRQIRAVDAEGSAGPAYRSARATAAGVGMFMTILLVAVVVVMVFKPQL
ncbi:MAG: DUF2269 family protein [Candidatus Dormibacteria bacterium]